MQKGSQRFTQEQQFLDYYEEQHNAKTAEERSRLFKQAIEDGILQVTEAPMGSLQKMFSP